VKIQETNIVDIAMTEARVALKIASHIDLAQSNEHVVATVYVPHEAGLPLEEVQLRALRRAADLIEQQSHALEHRLGRR
jgi:hypothetical protein